MISFIRHALFISLATAVALQSCGKQVGSDTNEGVSTTLQASPVPTIMKSQIVIGRVEKTKLKNQNLRGVEFALVREELLDKRSPITYHQAFAGGQPIYPQQQGYPPQQGFPGQPSYPQQGFPGQPSYPQQGLPGQQGVQVPFHVPFGGQPGGNCVGAGCGSNPICGGGPCNDFFGGAQLEALLNAQLASFLGYITYNLQTALVSIQPVLVGGTTQPFPYGATSSYVYSSSVDYGNQRYFDYRPGQTPYMTP